MKFNKSTIALAVCAAIGSSGAMAAQNYAAAAKIYIGGATATDNTLEEGLISNVGGLCDTAQPIDIYRSGTNQRVVICTTRATVTGAGSQLVAVHKESNGGSSNGIVPLTQGNAHSLVWLNVGALPNDCTVTTVAATANLAGYTNHAGCANVTIGAPAAIPTGGISDTEPALSFPAVLNATTFMTVTPVLDIVFGVPVTKNVYKALQIAQFGDVSACDTNPAANAYTISDTDSACVPSLTSSQVRALYSQSYTDWNNIVRRSDGTALSAIPGVVGPAGGDTSVRICRRVASSGTQAGAESYWLNQRCVATTQQFATPDDNSSVTDTTYVASDFANSLVNAAPSSGNARSCMQAAQGLNLWGIGVLSTEVTASNLSNAGDSFRFVAIDGVAPTLANVANGRYTYFTSNVITKANSASGIPGAVMSYLPTILGNTAVIANLNATFANRPWGNAGILAKQGSVTSNTAPYSDAELASSPVNTLTKGGNNCLQPWPVNATPAL